MALETGTYINDLVITNPASSDPKSDGDDHIRLLKSTLKSTFANIAGAVTATQAEINYTAGGTSSFQTQINAKAPTASPALTGTPTAPTALAGTSTTQLATTEFVVATAFSPILPGQTGNNNKRLKTNGNLATWDFTGTRIAPIAGGTLTDAGSMYSIVANAAYTLPDLSQTESFGLTFPTNAVSVPSTVTTSDGWTVTTGATAGTIRTILPISYGSTHGVWTGQALTPPLIATQTMGSPTWTVAGSAQLDTNLYVLCFRDNMYDCRVAAYNSSTGTFGATVTIGSFSFIGGAGNSALFADTATSFVCGFHSGTTKYSVFACSVNATTLVITAGTVAATPSVAESQPIIKLATGSYVLSVINATDIYAINVTGTTCTVGVGVASGALASANGSRIIRSSNTEVLIVGCSAGGGTAATRALFARIASISFTTVTMQTAATGASIYMDDLRIIKSWVDGASYLVCCGNGSPTTTGNYHVVTVAGAAATLGAINSQALNLPTAYYDSSLVYKLAESVYKYNATTILIGSLTTGPFAVTLSGTTCTVGAAGGPSSAVNFISDTATGTQVYAVGSEAFDKISVTGSTVASVWQVAATPTLIMSDTLNNKAVSYSGIWYAWKLPTAMLAIEATKWLFRESSTITSRGPIS